MNQIWEFDLSEIDLYFGGCATNSMNMNSSSTSDEKNRCGVDEANWKWAKTGKGHREILISPSQIARHHYWSFFIQRRFEIVFKHCLQMSGNELYVDDVWLVNYWHSATSVAMMAKEKVVHYGSRISFSFVNNNCIYFGYLLLSLVS